MKNRIHLYVSRKNAATWLMALCMVCSAVARIFFSTGVEGAGLWSQIVLPIAAVLLFALIALLSGKEMFHKTAIAVWLMGLSYCLQFYAGRESMLQFGAYATCAVFFCLLYTWISCGWLRYPWLLLPLDVAVLGAMVHSWRQGGIFGLGDIIAAAGLLVLLFALKVHTDGKYHPTWGDRIDGRRIRSTPAMDQIVPYLMVTRNEANNLFEESVEITNLERYVRKKRREGLTSFGMTHVIIAAYVRTVAKFPGLNRFLAGQKVYARGEDIALCMTVKKEMSKDSPDTVIKAHFTPYDTAEQVYAKFNEQVEIAKSTGLESGTDNTAGIMALIPGLMLKFVVWLLKVLDYFGLIPAFLLEFSPFHGSAYFTSMGSLGIRPIYHHLYNFGTIPVFVAFGRKRRAEELSEGIPVERKYVDLKFNIDERICDGFYYASLIKYFVRLLHNPDILDLPPEEVVKDID